MKTKPVQIEVGEWLFKGCFIQESIHPQLIGKYEVFKNNETQDHVGRCYTFTEAKKMCIENECFDNYLEFLMIAYKLFRKMKDGSISPLFINKKSRLPIGEWLVAENHPTKGFAVRQGWHCTLTPKAPHLSTNNREWYIVEIDDFEYYYRPESQGGTWVLAQKMKIVRPLV